MKDNSMYREKKNKEMLLGSAEGIIETTELVGESSTHDTEIQKLIRKKYSLSQELSVLRRHAVGIISEEEFKEYSDYIEECIRQVPEDNDSSEVNL